MRYPNIVNAYELADPTSILRSVQAGLPDGRWVVARCEGFCSLRSRVRAAWLVWTGRADALVWPGQES